LRNKGWTVQTNIGASSHKIDIAVVHPDKPEQYLAGIECCGEAYKNSASAKDREKLRPSVLEGLGWKVIKIWPIDWFTDKKGSIENLDNTLKKLYKHL